QAGHRRFQGAGRAGLPAGGAPEGPARGAPGLRRGHPALPGALPGPVVQQPAGRRHDVRGRHDRRRGGLGRLDRPGDGRSGPLMTNPPSRPGSAAVDARAARHSYPSEVLERLSADAEQILAKYPEARSALLPLLHLVQSEDGYVSPAGIAFCSDVLELYRASVSAVATFYIYYTLYLIGD